MSFIFRDIFDHMLLIQEELKFQPPVVLTLEDTEVANGVMNGHTLMHLEPGRWPAVLWY